MLFKEPILVDCGKLYHVANPIFREGILKDGLTPQIGDCYKLQYCDYNVVPAIFFTVNKVLFESGWDDDVWEIDLAKTNNIKLYQDIYIDRAVVSLETINPIALTLHYKGSGEDVYKLSKEKFEIAKQLWVTI